MFRVAFYFLLLLGLLGLALWRGRTDERLAAGVCVAGSLLTLIAGHNLGVRTSDFNGPAFLVDAGVFLAFLGIALRSSRFWPLWVAGLQLSSTSIHVILYFSPALPGMVFGAALAFWSYPILILIAIGAWRTRMVERWRASADIASSTAIT